MLFFAMSANCLFMATTPSFAIEHGVPLEVLSIVMAATGACEIVCRVVNGWVADRKLVTVLVQLSAVLLMTSGAMFLAAIIPGIVGTCDPPLVYLGQLLPQRVCE